MPGDLRERFVRAGLSHLLVVSGFNVAILALALSWVLARVPALPRAVLVCLGIAAFALFVGLDPPVVRAALAGVCSYFAIAFGRSFSVLALLSAVMVAMLCVSPWSLALDPSFQLSFLAVAGLVLLRPVFVRVFARVPAALGARESLALTFAALVATMPVTMLSFGQISLVAPLSNLLAAPAAALATVLGAVSLLLATISPMLAYPAGFVEDLALRWILLAARLGDLPFASFELSFAELSPVVAAYTALLGALALYRGFSSSRSKNSGS